MSHADVSVVSGPRAADAAADGSTSGEAAGSGMIEIQTTRFGLLEVDAERILTFPRGLLGFPTYQRYALIQAGEDNYFFWLQCVDEPNLAFVVTDPAIFFKTYD